MSIEIYGKDNCPWCVKLVEYLIEQGVEFTYEKLVSEEQKQRLLNQGVTAVPAVFLNGEYVGGHDQTIKLHKEGKLVEGGVMLARRKVAE